VFLFFSKKSQSTWAGGIKFDTIQGNPEGLNKKFFNSEGFSYFYSTLHIFRL